MRWHTVIVVLAVVFSSFARSAAATAATTTKVPCPPCPAGIVLEGNSGSPSCLAWCKKQSSCSYPPGHALVGAAAVYGHHQHCTCCPYASGGPLCASCHAPVVWSRIENATTIAGWMNNPNWPPPPHPTNLGRTDTADACEALCKANSTCHTWTWFADGEKPPPGANKYVPGPSPFRFPKSCAGSKPRETPHPVESAVAFSLDYEEKGAVSGYDSTAMCVPNGNDIFIYNHSLCPALTCKGCLGITPRYGPDHPNVWCYRQPSWQQSGSTCVRDGAPLPDNCANPKQVVDPTKKRGACSSCDDPACGAVPTAAPTIAPPGKCATKGEACTPNGPGAHSQSDCCAGTMCNYAGWPCSPPCWTCG